MSDLFLLRIALKDLFRIKRLIPALLLALTPLCIALAARSIVPAAKFVAADYYNLLAEVFIFRLILVLIACIFATSTIAQEIEQKTIVYLLTRPIQRWRILLMKYAAAMLATTAIVWLASLLLMLGTYGLSGWGGSHLGRDLGILFCGSLAYNALFLLLATLFNRPLILALVYAFGIEGVVPTIPGNFKMIALQSYLNVLAPHQPQPPLQTSDLLTPTLARWVVAGVIVVALALAMLVFSTREYVPREDL